MPKQCEECKYWSFDDKDCLLGRRPLKCRSPEPRHEDKTLIDRLLRLRMEEVERKTARKRRRWKPLEK